MTKDSQRVMNYKLMNKKTLFITALTAATFFSAAPAFASDMMMTQHYNQGAASWFSTNDVKAYNVYYKEAGDKKYTHAVRWVPKTMLAYTIKHLKQNTVYKYNVASVGYNGKEHSWSGEKILVTSPMK